MIDKTKYTDGTLQPDQFPLNVGWPGTQTASEHQDIFLFLFQLVNGSFQLLLRGNTVNSHNLIATKYGFLGLKYGSLILMASQLEDQGWILRLFMQTYQYDLGKLFFFKSRIREATQPHVVCE